MASDDITEGLWLEERGVRLAWHAPLARLRAVTRPDFCRNLRDWPPITMVAWTDRVWNGLACRAITVFDDIRQTRNELLGVRLAIVPPGPSRSARDAYLWLNDHLVRRFGPAAAPAASQDGNGCHQTDQDESFWKIGNVIILHRGFQGPSSGNSVFLFVTENGATWTDSSGDPALLSNPSI